MDAKYTFMQFKDGLSGLMIRSKLLSATVNPLTQTEVLLNELYSQILKDHPDYPNL